MKILLTGFDPFGGEQVNPALEAVKRVAAPDFELVKLTVPTVFEEAAQVVFYSDAVYSWERVTRGKGITHASCRFMPNDTYIRVEVTDEQGRTAWSTPVPIRRG